MNLNAKIILLIAVSFTAASSVLTASAGYLLKKSQDRSMELFKLEFLEIGRELFDDSSELFFSSLDQAIQGSESSQSEAAQKVIDDIKKAAPADGSVVIIRISDGSFVPGFESQGGASLFDKTTTDGYLRQNILNEKIDFENDNFNEFAAEGGNSITPSKIHFRIYENAGLMVGYSKSFSSVKVRIGFIQKQNLEIFKSNIYISLWVLLGTLLLASILSILYMRGAIVLPLQRVAQGLKRVEKGDLDTRLSHPKKDEIGEIAGAFNDMTHRLKSTYGELDAEKARLLASINSLSFGFTIVDMQHKIILGNRALMDLFEFSDIKDVTIKKISELLGGFDIEREADRCLQGHTVCEIKEIAFKKKILRGIVAPIMSRDEAETKIGYVLLLEDITEAKVMERSRDEFFAVASHELRTPLTAIRGNAEMIMDTFGDEIKNPDMKEMLIDIDNSSIRLIDIVNDFLEVSRLEQGRVEIKKTRFDMTEVITKVIKDFKSTADKKGIYLRFVPPNPSVALAMSDKNRVEQILFNLIGNSMKFTQSGGITVNLAQSGNFLKVQVSDTGIGISEQNQNRLFRKFQQAGEDMIARDVTQGTGLGLYICHQLISYMGGTIGIEQSELGKGSIFSFTIPVAE